MNKPTDAREIARTHAWPPSFSSYIMRLSLLLVGLLAKYTLAFAFAAGGALRSHLCDRPRTFPIICAGQFDNWWMERRGRTGDISLDNRPSHGTASTADGLALTRENLSLVLTEFVQSDFCRQACNYCMVEGTAYGQVDGMFEYVRIRGARIDVKIRRSFEQRRMVLLDRLAKYLRARFPNQIAEITTQSRDGTEIF